MIGNPPYIRIQTLKEWAPLQVEIFKNTYAAAGAGNYDIYVVFVEKALSLLNARGRMGFILPSKFFSTDYGKNLRQLIGERRALSQVVDFGHAQVFDQATTYTCFLFLNGEATESVQYAKVLTPPSIVDEQIQFRSIASDTLSQAPWDFGTQPENIVVEKIFRNARPLGDLPARIARGSSSGADDIFILRFDGEHLTTRDGVIVEIEEDILRVPIYATDFARYSFTPKRDERILFPYHISAEGSQLFSTTELQDNFPKAYKYFAQHRKALEARKQFKSWYSFSAPRNLEFHEKAHMLVPLLAERGSYCRLPSDLSKYCLMASGGFSITVGEKEKISPNYVLGLLNSSLLFWRLRSISNVFRGGWITCTKQYVETLPIRLINFSDPQDVARHEKMVALVERMLTLQQHHASAVTQTERDLFARQIEQTDRAIDELVYELYEVNEEERAVVESKT